MIFNPHAYQQHCVNKILEIAKLGLSGYGLRQDRHNADSDPDSRSMTGFSSGRFW